MQQLLCKCNVWIPKRPRQGVFSVTFTDHTNKRFNSDFFSQLQLLFQQDVSDLIRHMRCQQTKVLYTHLSLYIHTHRKCIPKLLLSTVISNIQMVNVTSISHANNVHNKCDQVFTLLCTSLMCVSLMCTHTVLHVCLWQTYMSRKYLVFLMGQQPDRWQ